MKCSLSDDDAEYSQCDVAELTSCLRVVHLKNESLLSSFTHVILNQYDLLSCVEHKKKVFSKSVGSKQYEGEKIRLGQTIHLSNSLLVTQLVIS